MESWRIGSTTVTRVPEQIGPNAVAPDSFYPDLDRGLLDRHLGWLAPTYYSPEQDRLISSIHSWVIRTGERTILVDGCAGNGKERPWNARFHRLDTPFVERLSSIGLSVEDIDIVLCTHLHADHVGWNTRLVDGRWVPTFPNARYLFSRTEDDYWRPGSPRVADDLGKSAVYADSVLPVVAAGQVDLFDGSHELERHLVAEPAPGHTPGHVVLKLDEPGGRACFCGDVVHHPIQLYAPHLNSAYCEMPDQARSSRRRVLDDCADSGALLFPTHFGPPFVAGILREGEAYAPDFPRGERARTDL